MTEHVQDDLSAKHSPEWAMFLPAISSFYISGLGQQQAGLQYFDQARLPAGIQDTEMLNFLNKQKGLYYYKWGLYSAGHADLDTTSNNPGENIIRNRAPGTFLLGDSGGFQIGKGVWKADWTNPNCPLAMKKRQQVLNWLDTYMDYGMVLDVPTWCTKTAEGRARTGINSFDESVTASLINHDYFINNRKGNCKFLNVIQGETYADADLWYDKVKHYCDPKKYPTNHFNGWALAGISNKDIQLILRRLVAMIRDGILEEGKHDLVHCLGISWMEYALLYTSIQKAVRKHHNPNLTITFDCASPFYAAAKGQCYYANRIEHGTKWSYRMSGTAENKSFAGDTRPFAQAVVQEGIHPQFTSSPITDRMTLGDLCYRGVGAVGKHGKETKTSWDTLSYTLIQGHNVWMHINAVQEANRSYEAGVIPAMLMDERFDRVLVDDIIDKVFAQKDYDKSMAVIADYAWLWNRIYKKGTSSQTYFNQLFEVEEDTPTEHSAEDLDTEELDADDAMMENLEE